MTTSARGQSGEASGAGDADVVVTARAEDAGARLDRLLLQHVPGHSRTRLQSLIKAGHVTCAGRTICDAGHRVKPGEGFTLRLPAAASPVPAGEAIPLTILFEDDSLLVIDKPAGLVVHPAGGHASGTLVNAIIGHCGASLSGIGGVRRPGIVHRLDKDTSGLLVVAKSDAAHRGLSEQFAAHGIDGRLKRSYLALVWGRPTPALGTIDRKLARSTANRLKMTVVGEAARGRQAVTHYEVLSSVRDAAGADLVSLLTVRLETGRTHQIRVHLAHAGHPLLGDTTYGQGFKASSNRLDSEPRQSLAALGRQALHAHTLGFTHPSSGKALEFTSAPPPELASLIKALGLGTRAPSRKRDRS